MLNMLGGGGGEGKEIIHLLVKICDISFFLEIFKLTTKVLEKGSAKVLIQGGKNICIQFVNFFFQVKVA